MVAIVTAGDSAIGRHLVLALAGAGHDVAFTHLNAAAMAARLEAEVAALGRRARAWETMRATRPRWSGSMPRPRIGPGRCRRFW